MEAMKEATGIDMRDIVRANSIEAKTDRNITIKTEDEEYTGSRAVRAAHVRPAAYRKALVFLTQPGRACPAPTEQ